MHERDFPQALRGHAIRTSDAADYGTSRQRLRAPIVQHPHHGVSALGLGAADVRDACRAYLPVMEAGQTFSHTTALALFGVPVPPPVEVHVSVAFPRTPPRRPRIRGHSLRDSPAVLREGMPVTPPTVAWAQSAALLSREELVAIGDRLVLDAGNGPAYATLDELAVLASSWAGRPGAERLSWAAAKVRHGVRSRPESLLRLLLVRSRLREPVVAHPVRVAGGIVLHPDLAYPDVRLALEYEGDGHRDEAQWERDIERRELLAEVRWRTIRVTRRQLFGDPRGVVARVRRHLRA